MLMMLASPRGVVVVWWVGWRGEGVGGAGWGEHLRRVCFLEIRTGGKREKKMCDNGTHAHYMDIQADAGHSVGDTHTHTYMHTCRGSHMVPGPLSCSLVSQSQMVLFFTLCWKWIQKSSHRPLQLYAPVPTFHTPSATPVARFVPAGYTAATPTPTCTTVLAP